jgi:hypothetical protein
VAVPAPTTIDLDIARVLREELAVYGEGAARVIREAEIHEGAGLCFTEVEPVRAGAAPLSLAYDGYAGGDTLLFEFDHTSFEYFPFSGEADLNFLRQAIRAVLAGRIEESGFKWNAHGRIYADDGVVRVGALSLPIPWRLRKILRIVRGYESYCPME